MDEEMGDAADFLSLEVDLDYEFDAARFFDFGRDESPAESRAAELWFESASSYPPSPFVAMLNIGKGIYESVNAFPKFKDEESTNSVTDHSDCGPALQFSVLDGRPIGLMIPCHTSQDVSEKDRKSVIKGPLSRGSTFMKPTASQLAKQNWPRDSKSSSRQIHRFQKPMVVKNENVLVDPSNNGTQAPKRQKVEGGHLCKVVGIVQQADLVHKVPQKKSESSTCNSHPSRLKITIPREPELQTAQRAQRLRSKNGKDLQGTVPMAPMFKAHPLNRKILEAPSFPFPQKTMPRMPKFQEFNLKTSERAVEHSLVSSSSLSSNNHHLSCTTQGGAGSSRRTVFQANGNSQLQNDDKKLEECGNTAVKFKARPLDKKIFSSKGGIGVFRTTKRETTRPMEVNLSSSKRCQQNPPIELFNKLSLNSEAQQSTASQAKLPWPTHVATKGTKENMINLVQEAPYSFQTNKEEFLRLGQNYSQAENGAVSGFKSQANTFRTLGIR